MKKCCFRERNYRTFCDSTLTTTKGTPLSALLKMVPLKRKSFANAHDYLRRLAQLRSAMSIPDFPIASQSLVSPLLPPITNAKTRHKGGFLALARFCFAIIGLKIMKQLPHPFLF